MTNHTDDTTPAGGKRRGKPDSMRPDGGLPGVDPNPVFKPDTGRDAKGSGSHQSGEGGSGNESGSSGSE